jgi:hypothetical protein
MLKGMSSQQNSGGQSIVKKYDLHDFTIQTNDVSEFLSQMERMVGSY